MKLLLKYMLLGGLLCISFGSNAQDLDIEAMTKDTKFKVSGGINADAMFFSSSAEKSTFTYMLTGSLNFSFLTFSMPVSYSITNQGNALNYKVPFDFNRFSIAPKYKWIKLYLGDHTLTYSPYTLNGHPFRGVGVELTPKGALKFSTMGGRLLKAVEEDKNIGQAAVFERYGSAIKVNFDKEKYKVEYSSLYAWDAKNSLEHPTDISPKSNYANTLKFATTFIKNLSLEVQYALSIIQEKTPLRAEDNSLDYLLSTSKSRAFDAHLNYLIGKANVGIVYENIDPTYRTFGAMYFNNDLENISLTFARPFFKDRVSITTQLGYQRDNLKEQKNQTAVRLVGSANVNAKISEKLNVSGSYSNFTSTTNRRLNEFDYINTPNMNPADTLTYRQLSQNGNVNMNYVFGKDKNQNVNFNYSIAGQANEQGGIIGRGQASLVQNYNAAHTISFSSLQMNVNTSANYTQNKVGRDSTNFYGGSVTVAKKFFENKLNTSLGTLYNRTNDSFGNSVLGIKCNVSYVLLEKHNFSFYGMQMFRSSQQKSAEDITLNVNYSYSF